MSKNKDAMAGKAVLEYLLKQNRPYSAIDIVNNLHKEYGKTAVVKCLESLAEEGKVKEKTYGKQKVYVADQNQFPEVDDNEIKLMDKRITELTETLQGVQSKTRQLESELRGLNSALTTEEVILQLEKVKQETKSYQNKLSEIKDGGKSVSPEEREQVMKNRAKYVKEWRKRKRTANDILSAILEGYPKTKKQLYDDIGVETDEEYNVSPPEL